MDRRLFAAVCGVVLTVLLLPGCASGPAPTPQPAPAQPEAPQPEPQPEPASPEPEQPAPDPAPEPPPEESPQPPKQEPDAPGSMQVSEELYDQTFTEIEQTIQELNDVIANRNFSAWQDYLTESYRRTYSNPDVLAESSQAAVLERNNIRLETLQDYFNFVVVPSRANARLDDLVFVDEQTVEAIMEVRGQRYLLYLLKKVDNRWKIDTF